MDVGGNKRYKFGFFLKHLCRNNIEYVLKSHPKNFLYIILCRKRKKFTKLQKHNIQAGTWILLYHHLHKYYFKSNIAHWGKKKILKISRQKFKILSHSVHITATHPQKKSHC